ncbi:MAG: ACP S-malonyltransferase [Rickettsiaceae bacterium]|nr:ACP S-malonyltransferase [Rickettsiaceae bacterium]
MRNRVFLFPGQGSQFLGMGKDLHDCFFAAREVFEEVDDALGQSLTSIIFGEDNEKLTLTENTQPALMAVSIAVIRVIKQETGKSFAELCDFAAGHSLGEYSALCAAGTMSLSDCAKLLRIRGRAMQSACPAGVGGMVACIGVPISELEEIINSNKHLRGNCQIANDNSIDQIVVSGRISAVDELVSIVKNAGKKAVKLKVSAPFHSSLMEPARIRMREALEDARLKSPAVPVIPNVLAYATTDPEVIREALTEQVTGRVRWTETMSFLVDNEVSDIFEIGASQVLGGLARRAPYGFSIVKSVGNLSEIEEFIRG